MNMFNKIILLVFISFIFLLTNVSSAPSSVFTPVKRLIARVGSYIVFDCDLEFPSGNDSPIPYILRWKKNVSYLLFIVM